MPQADCVLLDANVLIALSDVDHTAHRRATAWFKAGSNNHAHFATCPITQGSLIRFMLRTRPGSTIQEAKGFLERIVSLKQHQFWSDTVSYLDLPMRSVIGHRQVTDAYLVALAQHHEAKLVTLDRALAALHPATTIRVD